MMHLDATTTDCRVVGWLVGCRAVAAANTCVQAFGIIVLYDWEGLFARLN